MQWLAIGLGAAIGACLRGWLARYNVSLLGFSGWSWLPLGTLLANVLGGLLIGMAVVWFEHFGHGLALHTSPVFSNQVRLFVITGFLGGLTTFSTFSAEVFALLNEGRLLPALALALLHLLLTLCATAIGFYAMRSAIAVLG